MSDEPAPAIFTASLLCGGCGALLETQSAAPDHGLACCPICGASLVEIAGAHTGQEALPPGPGTRIVVINPPVRPDQDPWHADGAPPLRVSAIRHHRPDTWTYTLDALEVTVHGFTDAEAMSELVAAVRASVRDVLAGTRRPDPRRETALRLSLADSQDRLEQVLGDALVLDDEHIERLLLEQDDTEDTA